MRNALKPKRLPTGTMDADAFERSLERERVHLRQEMAGLEAYSPFRKSGAPT